MKRKGRQAQLSQLLAATTGRLDRKNAGGAASAKVGTAWLKIVGPTVQGHTTGAHLREGTLVVYVDSPAWATELSAMSERYRGAINEEVGQDLVSVIRFSVSKKVSEANRIVTEQGQLESFYRQDDVPSIALTEQEMAQVRDSVSRIDEPELREAVLRATVKDLEWKKGIAARNSREEPREGP